MAASEQVYSIKETSTHPSPWHALESDEVLRRIDVQLHQGLSPAEVMKRRVEFGPNTIITAPGRSTWRVLVDQFSNIVIGLLAAAVLLAWLTGDRIEALAILVVLLLNAAVGFLTEWEAGRTLEALKKESRTAARVRRGGFESTVAAQELVPGDIVVLNAGDRVPADVRIIESSQLQAEESALTGESTTVEKSPAVVAGDASLAERFSMLYLGTAVTSGHCVAVVVDTGVRTELGRVGHLVASSTKEQSPLEQRLAALGKRLVYVVLGVAAVVIVTGWLRGDGLWIMVEVGISLAVAAVPEGLPAVTTLILAIGVLRMAKQRAIVRRLPAVETLGSATVICSDKTGTLTQNRMTVREYYLSDGRTVTIDEDIQSSNDRLLERAVRIGVLCNEASFQDGTKEGLRAVGDPTETALLVVADALVLDVSRERGQYPKSAEQPFQSSTRRMTTVHRLREGGHFAALKGAPGVVLDACSRYAADSVSDVVFTEREHDRFVTANQAMADRALRVLALAVKEFEEDHGHPTDDELESGYTFLGFVGMIDPPSPGVSAAIASAREAGVRTVMLTGDQLNTGKAIARELGIGGEDPRAIHARELVGVGPQQLGVVARSVDVFARVSPEDKLRIVEALQQAGEIVAVTGDGVNDAPALKRADIGIAMGQRGTEVAKDAADIVLADDNFRTIVRAIEGGRTIYSNITKFVHLMFSHNLAEVIVIFFAIAIGWPLPLMPLQILWMNLVTDVFPALALALEPSSPDVMRQPPHPATSSLVSKPFVVLIAWQSVLLALLGLIAYAWALSMYGAGEHSRTIALFALIGIQLGHVFNCRSRTRSAISGIFRNPFLWLAVLVVTTLQLLAVYLTPLSRVLRTVPPTQADWLVIAACTVTPIVVVEIVKWIMRRRKCEGVVINTGEQPQR